MAPCIGPDGGKELHEIRPEHGDIHIIVPGDEALVAHSTDEGTVHQVIFQPVFSAFIPDIAKHTQLQLLQLFRPDLRFHAPLLSHDRPRACFSCSTSFWLLSSMHMLCTACCTRRQ